MLHTSITNCQLTESDTRQCAPHLHVQPQTKKEPFSFDSRVPKVSRRKCKFDLEMQARKEIEYAQLHTQIEVITRCCTRKHMCLGAIGEEHQT